MENHQHQKGVNRFILRRKYGRKGHGRCKKGRDSRPPLIHEVKELQTALGLVAAETGLCVVPASVERLRRDNVVYRPINDQAAVSPIIMSTRKGDHSPEIALILRTIQDVYKAEGVVFGQ